MARANAYKMRGVLAQPFNPKFIELAIADYSQAIGRGVYVGIISYQRARCYERIGRNDLAIADLKRVITTPASGEYTEELKVGFVKDAREG